MVHLVVVMMLVVCVARRVSSNYILLHTDKIVTLTPTNVSPSASSRHCARKCYSTYPCISYAYHPGRAQCYLYNTKIHKEDSTNVDNGTKTYSFEFNEYNVAFVKPVAQSSGPAIKWQVPARGVNGIKESDFFQTDDIGWWCVDLLAVYELKWIILYTPFQYGYLKRRLKGYEIWLTETSGCSETGFSSSTLCYRDTTNTAQNIYTIKNCSQPNSQFDARYVFIYQPNHSLNLEEVEVVPWCT